MDSIFVIALVVYVILIAVMAIFNVIAVRHILKYRYKGDASISVLFGYVLVLVVMVFITIFSLIAVSMGGA